jgi:hypothetical protein
VTSKGTDLADYILPITQEMTQHAYVMANEIRRHQDVYAAGNYQAVFKLWISRMGQLTDELQKFERISTGSSALSKEISKYTENL